MGAIKDYYAEEAAAFFEIAERAVALHEAGHAVAAVAMAGLGVPAKVWIVAKGKNDTRYQRNVFGRCSYACFTREMNTPEDIIALAALDLAGQCAEAVFDKDHYRPSASDEIVKAQTALLELGQGRLGLSYENALALIVFVQIAVRKILAANAAAVERVAAALIVQRKLYTPALFRLLADVNECDPPIGEWVLGNVSHPK